MIPPPVRMAALLLALVAVIAVPPSRAAGTPAAGPRGLVGCPVGGVEVDLAGSGDTAVVSGHGASAAGCRPGPGRGPAGAPGPYSTYEIACSTDRARAAQGLCAATPCTGGRFFAFRTLHLPDGRTQPAGSSCVSLARAQVGPTLTAAAVFAAIRRVELPPGVIHVTPGGRGLANVPSRLWLAGDVEPPLDLRLAGSTIHADFQPVRYHWTATLAGAAAGAVAVTAGGGRAGRDGEAGVTFARGGEFVVTVVTSWSASAFLDGRFVGQVDDLASTTRIVYPVLELRTALSG